MNIPHLMRTTAILILLLPAFPAWTADAQGQSALGTLFFTPTERVALALARRGEALTEARTDIMVNGLVSRPEQKGMVWINGHKMPEGSAIPPISTPVISKAGIKLNEKDVKVGEKIDLDSGNRIDLVPSGAISIRRKN